MLHTTFPVLQITLFLTAPVAGYSYIYIQASPCVTDALYEARPGQCSPKTVPPPGGQAQESTGTHHYMYSMDLFGS